MCVRRLLLLPLYFIANIPVIINIIIIVIIIRLAPKPIFAISSFTSKMINESAAKTNIWCAKWLHVQTPSYYIHIGRCLKMHCREMFLFCDLRYVVLSSAQSSHARAQSTERGKIYMAKSAPFKHSVPMHIAHKENNIKIPIDRRQQ